MSFAEVEFWNISSGSTILNELILMHNAIKKDMFKVYFKLSKKDYFAC